MKQKYLIAIIILSNLLLLTSCGQIAKAIANKQITEEKGAIPPDLGIENSIVLFTTNKKSYNRFLYNNIEKRFSGEHLILSEEELNSNKKYQDSIKYRFIFGYSYISPGTGTYKYTTRKTSSGSISTYENHDPLYNVKKFGIYDRKENHFYRCKVTSSFWGKIMKVYLKKMNEKVISYNTQIKN